MFRIASTPDQSGLENILRGRAECLFRPLAAAPYRRVAMSKLSPPFQRRLWPFGFVEGSELISYKRLGMECKSHDRHPTPLWCGEYFPPLWVANRNYT